MSARYTGTAVVLHWIVAALIIGNLLFGYYLVDLPLSPAKLRYFSWHKWVGVTVFGIAAVRLLWRLAYPPPPLPQSMRSWEVGTARVTHALLYMFFFITPLSGWLFSSAAGIQTVYLGVLPIPDLLGKNKELADGLKMAHHWIAYALSALVAWHVAAALKHHFVDRDEVLARMIPLLRKSPDTDS